MDTTNQNKGGYMGTGQYGTFNGVTYNAPDAKNPYGSYTTNTPPTPPPVTTNNPVTGNTQTSTPNTTSSTNYGTPEQNKTISDATSKLNDLGTQLDDAYKTFKDTMAGYTNGSIPLTPGEQAQVNGLTSQYQQLIEQQKLQNKGAEGTANIRGYQTGAAEYDPTFQAKTIGSIVTAGLQKIADLNTKMASSVAALTQSFKENDMKAIKDAYDEYKSYQKEKVDALQKTIDDTQKAIKDARDFAYKKETDLRDFNEKVREFTENKKLDEKKYGLEAMKLQHQLEVDSATNVQGLDDKGLEMLAKGYLTSGVLPAVGYGKSAVAMRTAIINKAVQLAGGNEAVNPAVNKAQYDANKKVLSQQQQNYTVADTAYRIFDKNGELALQLAQGLNKSNSPIINQLSNKVINQTTGTGQLDSFRAVITSLQSEYATLINVKGGGGGQVTEGDKAKAEKAIPFDISPARLKSVLDNLKTEGRNVLEERKQTIDTISKNIAGTANTYNNQVATKPIVGQINNAKSSGYTSQEIINYLSSDPTYSESIKQAKASGYTDDEIINYLSTL